MLLHGLWLAFGVALAQPASTVPNGLCNALLAEGRVCNVVGAPVVNASEMSGTVLAPYLTDAGEPVGPACRRMTRSTDAKGRITLRESHFLDPAGDCVENPDLLSTPIAAQTNPDGTVSGRAVVAACTAALRRIDEGAYCDVRPIPSMLPTAPTTLREAIERFQAVETGVGRPFVFSLNHQGSTPVFHGRYWESRPRRIVDESAILDVERRRRELLERYQSGAIDAATFDEGMQDLAFEDHANAAEAEASAEPTP